MKNPAVETAGYLNERNCFFIYIRPLTVSEEYKKYYSGIFSFKASHRKSGNRTF